jgi:hypothetical protein
VAVLNGRAVRDELEANHVLDEIRVFRAERSGTYRIVISLDPGSAPIASWTLNVS